MFKAKPHKAWLMLAASCLFMAGTTGIVLNSMGIFLPPVCNDLGFRAGDWSFHITLRNLSTCIILPFAGRYYSRAKKGHICMILMLIVCLTASGLMSLYTSLIQWYISGIVIGITGGFLFWVPIPVLLNNWFSKKKGTAIGIAMAFASISGTIMNPLGNYFILTFGWQNTYIIMAAIGLILALPLTFFVRFSPSDIGCRPYGEDDAAAITILNSKPNEGSAPVIRKLSTSVFIMMILAVGFISMGNQVVNNYPTYAVSENLSTYIGSVMVSLGMLGAMFGKLSLGAISDKFGAEKTMLGGILSVGSAFLIILLSDQRLLILWLGAFLSGNVYSLTSVMLPLVTRRITTSESFSKTYSVLASGSSFFSAISVTLLGYLYDLTGAYSLNLLLVSTANYTAMILLFIVFTKTGTIKRNPILIKNSFS